MANLPLFFWHYLAVSNYKWKMGQLVVAFSKYLNFMNYYNDWIRNWKDFLIFLEQYEMELTIYFLFCLLSGAHRPHCPKATKLTYVWCNLKKNLYHSKWCMNKNTKPVSASQFQQQKQRNGDFIFWNYQIINKNYKPSISTLHLCEKKTKKIC